MFLKIFQVDAFTDRLFCGNPAAVIELADWLPDQTLQAIAMENNLSETAYFIQKDDFFHIRWFTPLKEVNLCGHATLATAHIIWKELRTESKQIIFQSKSGELRVNKDDLFYTLDFPTDQIAEIETPSIIKDVFKGEEMVTFKGREDYLVVFASEKVIENLQPDFKKLAELESRGVIATAKGNNVDFVSRCFYPYFGIDEDPVTGSAHTTLAPYWSNSLNKNELTANQISKRGGSLKIKLIGNRTLISGQAVTYLKGEIRV